MFYLERGASHSPLESSIWRSRIPPTLGYLPTMVNMLKDLVETFVPLLSEVSSPRLPVFTLSFASLAVTPKLFRGPDVSL